ncbi:hypothetical protein ACQPWO_32230, partial [Escherichia coli]
SKSLITDRLTDLNLMFFKPLNLATSIYFSVAAEFLGVKNGNARNNFGTDIYRSNVATFFSFVLIMYSTV